ncbi:MAG TPA: serine/threonine-protein kinase, partial [Gemmataceae bacterium]
SDGGKEVALKLIKCHSETELRGIAQCLNLKHPNLVHLYDLRSDSQSRHWLVMEYVLGESLAQLMHRNPRGLPEEVAREWFLALARGVNYLHDHGVAHRDLKPGNVFVESGTVKIGDYGLCKAMSSSQRAAQTQQVGTALYMAPEVVKGDYNHRVDIYALGAIFYEMLTGRPPFEGDSHYDLIVKHQTATPDFTGVPEGYARVIRKAMEKIPARRYESAAEMARDVEAVAHPAPALLAETLLLEASAANGPAPALRAAAETAPAAFPRLGPAARPAARPGPAPMTDRPTVRGQVAELTDSLLGSALLALLAPGLWAGFTRSLDWFVLGKLYLLTVALSWAVLIPAKFWRHAAGNSWRRRGAMAALGLLVGVGAFWLQGWNPRLVGVGDAPAAPGRAYLGGWLEMPPGGWSSAVGYALYFALGMALLAGWKFTDRRRPERWTLFPLIAGGVLGVVLQLIVALVNAHPPTYFALALGMSLLAAQAVSPWSPPPPAPARRVRLRAA